MRYRIRHLVEYAALRGTVGLFRMLPYRCALAAGCVVAWIGHYLVRFRRRDARARIRQVLGPDVPHRRIRRIAWISWRNLCFNAVEIARFPKLTPGWIETHMDGHGLRKLQASIAEGRGAVMAVPHAGNWDLAGIAMHRLGAPMFFLARRQRNPLTDSFLNRMRNSTGVETVLTDSGLLRQVLRKLRQGMYLAILPDVRSLTPALDVPFLGAQANLNPGMALFARQAGVAIHPCTLMRKGWTRHRIHVLKPVVPDPALPRDEDLLRMTRRVMTEFDAFIRAHPEQYFWYNKRWVLDPLR